MDFIDKYNAIGLINPASSSEIREAIKISEEIYTFFKKALEAAEKYKWHDLLKDPEDLPEKSGFYLIAYRSLPGIVMNPDYIVFYFYRSNEGKYAEWQAPNYVTVIAWKEIEPFDGEILQ